MKRIALVTSGIAALVMLSIATPSFAAPGDKEKTISGEAKCGKCALHETEKCQTVISSENKKGKTVKYYLADNDVAKAFHSKVCKGSQKVTATGTVKKVDGKQEFTATNIKVASE